MATDLQDFHYMSVLRGLEKSVVKLHGRGESSDRKMAHRIGKVVFREMLLGLMEKDPVKRINVALESDRDSQLATEKEIVDHILELTEGRKSASADHQAAGEWPPILPPARIVERFTAFAIGRHAETPGQPFAVALTDAFRTAVIPALAWGLMIRLIPHTDEVRAEIQQGLARRFREKPTPYSTDVNLDASGRSVPLGYLRMVEAWFDLLISEESWRMVSEDVAGLRAELADLLALPFTDLDTTLWGRLGTQYLAVLDGSERARLVAGAGAKFMKERLGLLDAAMKPTLQDFRLQLERDPARACHHPFKAYAAGAEAPLAVGEEACGAAFWLARRAFGQHGGQTFDVARQCSLRALVLILRAGTLLRYSEEHVLTCVRFAAGLATNPRYARSLLALDRQKRLVDLYASLPKARASIVEHFRGRIAWQEWKAGNPEARADAMRHYLKALKRHREGSAGFDAEAPLHFFPELVVLLESAQKRGEREIATLRAVDFITQRNYGIYFDIDREKQLIAAGLDDYVKYHQSKAEFEQRKLAARRAEADRVEASLGESSEENEWAVAARQEEAGQLENDLLSIGGFRVGKRA